MKALSNRQLLVLKTLSPLHAEIYKASLTSRIERDLIDFIKYKVSDTKWALKLTHESDTKDLLKQKLSRWGNDGSWGRYQLEQLRRALFINKQPTDHTEWVSIEIECIVPDKAQYNMFIGDLKAKNLAKFVTIKDDASIHVERSDEWEYCSTDCEDSGEPCDECHCQTGQAFGKEVVITCKQYDFAVIRAICGLMALHDFTVNKSCGLHVHFDCRHLNAREVSLRAKRVALCVPALKSMLPRSRQNNTFCAEPINKMRGGSRYAFVNLHAFKKYSTLEIRGHSGTTDADKIINWIVLIKNIMEKRNAKPKNTVVEMLSIISVSQDISNYVLERYTKFNGATNSTQDDVEADNQSCRSQTEMVA